MARQYILVTGGSFLNKGAQAMTFITVDQMARRFPDCQVVLFSHYEARLPEAEKRKYKLLFLRFPRKMQRMMLRFNLRNEYTELFQNAAAMLDISGYRLGSNWGISSVKGYLQKIELARHFGIPVYLMPQSFGPFDFHGFKSWGLMTRIRKTLSYPKIIMAREEQGFRLLKEHFGLENLLLTPDLVLQAPEIRPENIFVSPKPPSPITVNDGAVAIIPNRRNTEYGRPGEILELYRQVISRLRGYGKTVCLLAHATEDRDLCRDLKRDLAPRDDMVQFLDHDFDCIEFGRLVQKFDFIVASRYHSIVHAYREAVPALIVGWADKYGELAKTMDQGGVFFDVRTPLDHGRILQALDALVVNHAQSAAKIRTRRSGLLTDCVYDHIQLKRAAR